MPVISHFANGVGRIESIPARRGGLQPQDACLRQLGGTEDVGSKTVQAFVVDKPLKGGKRDALRCVVEKPGLRMPAPIHNKPAQPAEHLAFVRSITRQRDPVDFHTGMPWIIPSRRFSTLRAPTSVASMASGIRFPSETSGVFSHPEASFVFGKTSWANRSALATRRNRSDSIAENRFLPRARNATVRSASPKLETRLFREICIPAVRSRIVEGGSPASIALIWVRSGALAN
jgi:hypothetical protein